MTDLNSNNNRTCSVCGQKKPLFAFLELSTKGYTYGDICATCRGAGLTRKKSPELEAAERSGGTSGLQIDSKKWLKEASEKQDQFKKTTERDYEEKLKKEITQEDKLEKKGTREADERRHREEYIQQKQKTPVKSTPGKEETTQVNQSKQEQRFYQGKAETSTDAANKGKAEEFGKKIDNVGPDFVAKVSAVSGRSADSLFGQQMGTLMKDYNKRNNLGSALDKFQQKTEAKPGFMGQNNAKEQSNKQVQQKESDKQALQKESENLATEFVKSNFMKR